MDQNRPAGSSSPKLPAGNLAATPLNEPLKIHQYEIVIFTASTIDVTTLPAETLAAIFSEVRESEGLAALLPCLTMCKSWSRPALSALWATVAIMETNLATFLLRFPYHDVGNGLPQRTRPLTVLISVDSQAPLGARAPGYGENPTADTLRDNLGRRATVTSRSFTGISTFSLNLSKHSQRPQHGPGF